MKPLFGDYRFLLPRKKERNKTVPKLERFPFGDYGFLLPNKTKVPQLARPSSRIESVLVGKGAQRLAQDLGARDRRSAGLAFAAGRQAHAADREVAGGRAGTWFGSLDV